MPCVRHGDDHIAASHVIRPLCFGTTGTEVLSSARWDTDVTPGDLRECPTLVRRDHGRVREAGLSMCGGLAFRIDREALDEHIAE
jgi:hypothetical protein